jgi:alkanesulfonate monooxygenase SsuD/methylene tetrahydromethanopterin reductase-like flavin-dependent oxidoreductase (luciferase family)
MRYALNLPPFGAFADVHALALLAREAEEAGWDGFFLWDHLQAQPGVPVADPWVALCAIALQTRRLRLGALVTPLPRRRPWKFARETVSLDHLCAGRLIVGVGIGGDTWFGEYRTFGESVDDRVHGAMLDEGLEVLTGLWSGQPFQHQGPYYTVRDALFLPPPLQTPRIPLWIAGIWPNKAPMRRAARWDGVCPIVEGHTMHPAEVRDMLTYIRKYRSADEPFDVVLGGSLGTRDPMEMADLLRRYAEAGVTWWQEGFLWQNTLDEVRARILQGPPAFDSTPGADSEPRARDLPGDTMSTSEHC